MGRACVVLGHRLREFAHLQKNMQSAVIKVPDETRMGQLVHDLNLPHVHPLRLRVQLRLVDQFHSHAVCNEVYQNKVNTDETPSIPTL